MGVMKRKAFFVVAAVCGISLLLNIGLLVHLHEVKTKQIYEEMLAGSITRAQNLAVDYQLAGSEMTYRYLIGELYVIRLMTSAMESRDYEAVREMYNLSVAYPTAMQAHMDKVTEILNLMEEDYDHPNLGNLIYRLRNEIEIGSDG